MKELNFQKSDFYINQYKKMKKYYFDIIKLQKSKKLFINFLEKKNIDFNKFIENLENENLYLSN